MSIGACSSASSQRRGKSRVPSLSTAAAQSKRVISCLSEGECTERTGKLIKHTVLISEICCPGWQRVYTYNRFSDTSKAQLS